jgi:hypothetical protein
MSKSRKASSATHWYEGLHFNIAEFQREAENFAIISRKFLEAESREKLKNWRQWLVTFRDSRTSDNKRWEIPEADPIRTLPTHEYEPKGKTGGFPVYGEISSVWEIGLIGGAGKKTKSQFMCLNGIASTKVKILCRDADQTTRQVAQWQFEVGDDNSPGCHFHIGIGGSGNASPEPAKHFPVPRLPSLLVTPIDALDFLLGEIFQMTWRQEVGQDSSAIQLWSAPQRDRLSRLLKWKQEEIDRSTGSAWNFLKHQRPSARILLQP